MGPHTEREACSPVWALGLRSSPLWAPGLTGFLPLDLDPLGWACPASLQSPPRGSLPCLFCLWLPLCCHCRPLIGLLGVHLHCFLTPKASVRLSASLGLPRSSPLSPPGLPLPAGHHLSISPPATHLGAEMAPVRGGAVRRVGLRPGPAGAPGGPGEASPGRGAPEGDPPQ